eukprot:Tamp_03568.p1 GENE.Tamp_03568~~Tamp_03568.p1  ORF type:complete len:1036 (-),score=260.28 Tamp_03568:551-3568(-)
MTLGRPVVNVGGTIADNKALHHGKDEEIKDDIMQDGSPAREDMIRPESLALETNLHHSKKNPLDNCLNGLDVGNIPNLPLSITSTLTSNFQQLHRGEMYRSDNGGVPSYQSTSAPFGEFDADNDPPRTYAEMTTMPAGIPRPMDFNYEAHFPEVGTRSQTQEQYKHTARSNTACTLRRTKTDVTPKPGTPVFVDTHKTGNTTSVRVTSPTKAHTPAVTTKPGTLAFVNKRKTDNTTSALAPTKTAANTKSGVLASAGTRKTADKDNDNRTKHMAGKGTTAGDAAFAKHAPWHANVEGKLAQRKPKRRGGLELWKGRPTPPLQREKKMKKKPKKLQVPATEIAQEYFDFDIYEVESAAVNIDQKIVPSLAETKNKPKAPAKKVAQDNFDSDSYAGGSAASNIDQKTVPALAQAKNEPLGLATFAPLMPVLDKLKNQDLQGALAAVMSSAAVLKVTARSDPEMPRNILKKVLQNVDFIAAVQKMRSRLPANMQSPLETLQSLSQDLQGDRDEMMEKLGGVMVECKEAFVQRPDIKFPQDLIKSVDPISILAMIGEKMPGPLKTAYSKALEVAAFTPLMPILDKLKNKDLEGALAVVMSSAAVLKATSKFDPEMPRNVLKKVLQSTGFQSALQQMASKLPANLQSPLQALQSLSQDLQGDTEEMMEKLGGVMVECKEAFVQRPDIKFPQDLIKSVDPIPILAMIGEKIPPPLDQAYNTALELAAFAPLMPILDKLKNKDLEGALAVVMSSSAVLKATAQFDPEMPRNVLKKVLQNAGFTAAVQKMLSKPPANLQPPLQALQSLSQDLEGDMDEMMEKLQGVMMECKRVFAQRPDIQFPRDLIKSVDPVSILALIGEKMPGPLKTAYSKALEVAASALKQGPRGAEWTLEEDLAVMQELKRIRHGVLSHKNMTEYEAGKIQHVLKVCCEQHRTVNAIRLRWHDKLKKRQTQLASSSAEAAACLEVPPLRCRVPHERSRNCVELIPCPHPSFEKCTNSQTGSWGWMLREV